MNGHYTFSYCTDCWQIGDYFARDGSYPTYGMKRKEREISFRGMDESIMHEECTLD